MDQRRFWSWKRSQPQRIRTIPDDRLRRWRFVHFIKFHRFIVTRDHLMDFETSVKYYDIQLFQMKMNSIKSFFFEFSYFCNGRFVCWFPCGCFYYVKLIKKVVNMFFFYPIFQKFAKGNFETNFQHTLLFCVNLINLNSTIEWAQYHLPNQYFD